MIVMFSYIKVLIKICSIVLKWHAIFHYTVPPRIIQNPVNTTVSEGSSASLTCQATGDPSPMVRILIIAHHILELIFKIIMLNIQHSYVCISLMPLCTSYQKHMANVFYVHHAWLLCSHCSDFMDVQQSHCC